MIFRKKPNTINILDVGSGAGAISRAADTHLAIRPHSEDGYVVIDAVTRSGPSPDAVSAKFDFPLWTLSDLEPELRSFEAMRDKNNNKSKSDAQEKREAIMEYMEGEASGLALTSAAMHEKLKLSTWGNLKTFRKHVDILVEEGRLKKLTSEAGSSSKRFTAR